MAWKTYDLDQQAQNLVLTAKKRNSDSLNQAYKMRMAIAYGLERFWGEQLRLAKQDPDKAAFWKDTWAALVKIVDKAGITLPNDAVKADNTQAVQAMSEKLWKIPLEDQRVILAVLAQLCDAIVWWTQRYKD
ncbi:MULTISPECIES: hypothetical protein [unclassified Synechocystis]|uniref:hypothetical protein n=1 Tax=unclassified Synechocystis TaxID=2640012 RepID=UPI000402A8D3|nr:MULTISPECIES: hypothetical protein [unclassified Synechocystis]AIE73554.1 hypothetical protein D082_10260 [Synechocystis sp. PCC 6714]MCT0254111.1 hypothetical protein [Synechocystis sp. CS-94]